VDSPCSRVGHIYRKFAPFSIGGSLGKVSVHTIQFWHDSCCNVHFVCQNYKRVAMVWMDEYAEYIYNRRPTYRSIDPGDISKQVALRERLQCKPFKWFMENIAFDLPKVYPPIEPNNFGDGYIRSIFDETLCVDAKGRTQYKRYT
jgi:polypeptide N-acetylgalactosaminyltransferase